MNSRILLSGARAAGRRAFTTSPARFDATASIGAAPLPVRKPVGALRGGYVPPSVHSRRHWLTFVTGSLFGFFFGATAAGAGIYTYALQDYKASNDLLTEDIYVRYCI